MGDIDEYIFDDDGNPIPMEYPNLQENQLFPDEEDVKDIFHIKSDGFDVILSLCRGLITWKNVSPGGGKKKGIFKGKNKHDDQQTVMLRDVFAVKMKRKKTSSNSEDDGICQGFILHVVDLAGPNMLAERVIVFEHPSEALCSMYVSKVEEYLAEMKGRPKSIKMFLQTHAGNKTNNATYKNKVLPLFQAADINVDCVAIQHNEHIKQEMIHMNLDDFDCIVAFGGDGTVNKVADGLLTSSQKYRDVELKPGFSPVKARISMGIIPTGSTNDVSRSIIGTDDVTTAALNIIMGRFTPVDVCSVYKDDKFQQWCFNCQYGFAGNVLTFRKRYKALGKRGLEPAFVKALTKAKLRSYKCDIEYVPADRPLPANKKLQPCYRGCDVCWNEVVANGDEVTQDLVQAFDPLAESNDSDTLVDLAQHEDTPWRTLKGDYLNIGLFTLPGRSDVAPHGLSKYTHLNDGVMDLVVVKDTERKEFIRLLKRLGNTKNQFDLPFVEVFRVKEVRFRLRLPIGFNYSDFSYSEIDYEIERRKNQMTGVNRSMEILEIDDEFSDSDDNVEEINSTPITVQSKPKEKPPMKKAQSFQVKNGKMLKRSNTEPVIMLEHTDSEEDSEDDEDENSEGSVETVSINANGVRTVRSAQAGDQRLVGPQYRMTFAEQDRAKRNKKRQKKEAKKKAKEEQRMKSVWNIDNEIREDSALDFRVHHGLLKIYGQGVATETVVQDTTILCLPRL